MTTHSILYLRDHELQMRFSQFEAFYPGHVPCRACSVSGMFRVGHVQCRAYSVSGMFSVGHVPCRACSVSGMFRVGHVQCRACSVSGMFMSGMFSVGHVQFRACSVSGMFNIFGCACASSISFAPLESLINILTNDRTNSIFLFDI